MVKAKVGKKVKVNVFRLISNFWLWGKKPSLRAGTRGKWGGGDRGWGLFHRLGGGCQKEGVQRKKTTMVLTEGGTFGLKSRSIF